MSNKEITHYWDIINLSNPPGVTFKCADGSIVYGNCQEGELPEQVRDTPEPHSFTGYFNDGTFGRKFGSWVPIEYWLNRK